MGGLRRTDVLLLVGMAAGAAIAAVSLVHDGSPNVGSVPHGVAAIVGDAVISRASLETAVGLVERDRGAPVTAAERRQVLERLVDEELLLQHGLALGLAASDRKVRADLVSAVIEASTAAADDVEPAPAQLQAFFEANRAAFRGPEALRVGQVFVASPPRSGEEAAERARRAADRLRAGEDLAIVRRELGDLPAVEIPASPLPSGKLREYVGSSAAAVARDLAEGGVSEPQAGPDGYRVLAMLERAGAAELSFEQHRDEVRAEYRRRAREQALRDDLARLRAATEISYAPEAADESR